MINLLLKLVSNKKLLSAIIILEIILFIVLPLTYLYFSGYFDCDKCGGDGFVWCTDCRGRGKELCQRCDDAGDGNCYICHGDGKDSEKKDCKTCKGEGFFFNKLTWETITCTKCNGLGVVFEDVECWLCDGDGDCNYCNASGLTNNTCKKCAGVGNVDCSECK